MKVDATRNVPSMKQLMQSQTRPQPKAAPTQKVMQDYKEILTKLLKQQTQIKQENLIRAISAESLKPV